mmetsp:Transcript_9504/g.15358  ORF Transcript_9504/g.15358 Transcript_9504/m.15358 type:complete len:445 (+) Transcript_9504:153-1487(+)
MHNSEDKLGMDFLLPLAQHPLPEIIPSSLKGRKNIKIEKRNSLGGCVRWAPASPQATSAFLDEHGFFEERAKVSKRIRLNPFSKKSKPTAKCDLGGIFGKSVLSKPPSTSVFWELSSQPSSYSACSDDDTGTIFQNEKESAGIIDFSEIWSSELTPKPETKSISPVEKEKNTEFEEEPLDARDLIFTPKMSLALPSTPIFGSRLPTPKFEGKFSTPPSPMSRKHFVIPIESDEDFSLHQEEKIEMIDLSNFWSAEGTPGVTKPKIKSISVVKKEKDTEENNKPLKIFKLGESFKLSTSSTHQKTEKDEKPMNSENKKFIQERKSTKPFGFPQSIKEDRQVLKRTQYSSCIRCKNQKRKCDLRICGQSLKIKCSRCLKANVPCVRQFKPLTKTMLKHLTSLSVTNKKRKRLADDLNPRKGQQCPRNSSCVRPRKHPGHCKLVPKP